jgi:hypothetical protein
MLLRAYDLHPDATQVNFIVSEKHTITKGLKNFTEVTKRWLQAENPGMGYLFGEFVPASMKTQLPLQTADTLCWHIQHYYRGGFKRTEENRMWYLLKERDGDLHVWRRDELQRIADDIAALSQS